MLQDARSALSRSAPTIAQDFLGCAALVAILLVALHLPGLI